MMGIPQIIRTLEQLLPPEVYIPLFVVLGIALVPSWFHWVRTKQIKGQLRRLLRATDPNDKATFRSRAFEFAHNKPRRLAFLADEALRLGLKPIHDEAMTALKAAGGHDDDVKRLEAATKVVPPRAQHPLEEAVVIERMLGEGLVEAARARLAEVRARFPGDHDLADLERRIDAPRPPADQADQAD